MGFLMRAFDEVGSVEPLAHQTSLHIHLNCQNSINLSGGKRLFQRIESQISRHQEVQFKQIIAGKPPRLSVPGGAACSWL